jgi:hypothetical protein
VKSSPLGPGVLVHTRGGRIKYKKPLCQGSLRVFQNFSEVGGLVKSLRATLWSIATRTTYRRRNVNLAGLFRTGPIAGIKNCYARLQKGKVIAMENQKTKIDQFKRSFP